MLCAGFGRMTRFALPKEISKIKLYQGGLRAFPGVKNPVKLSSNETPLGPSPKAIRAFKSAQRELAIYPESSVSLLRQKIASRFGLDEEQLVCGAGSDDLLQLCARLALRPGDEGIHTQHGFSLYPTLIRAAGGVPIAAAEKNLRADIESILKCVTKKTKMVFLANPNNPTGTYLDADELRALRKKLPQNILLVVDAAYAEYVVHNDYDSGIELVKRSDNVVMTRTFSKIHGLASLRLGWAYAPKKIADALNRVRLPFNVSTPALMAGLAAFDDAAWTQKALRHNQQWKNYLQENLSPLVATSSAANFILLKFKNKKTAHAAWHFLGTRGLILRRMEEYGLNACLRASIGRGRDNRKLVNSLKEFMGQHR